MLKMNLRIFWTFLYALLLAKGEVKVFYLSQDTDNIPNSGPLKVIEHINLEFNCTSSNLNASFVWTKGSVVLSYNSVLSIQRVSDRDAGQYQCQATSSQVYVENKLLLVEILQPPSTISTGVPGSLLYGETLTLTAVSTGNPEPTFEWRKDASNGILMSKDKTYTFTPSTDFYVYCIATNRMAPTFGEYRLGFTYTKLAIDFQYKAEMLVPGDTLDLKCVTSGYPRVEIWWTKQGDTFFSWKAERYLVVGVNQSHSGLYTCNVRNNVTLANGNTRTIYDSADFTVNVDNTAHASTMKSTCPDCCTSEESSACNMATRSKTMEPAVKETENCYNKTTFDGLLSALCIIAVITLTSICINFYFVRRKTVPPKTDEKQIEKNISGTAMNIHSSHEPTPCSDLVLTDHHYTVAQPYYTDVNHYAQIYPSVGRNNDVANVTRQSSTDSYFRPVEDSALSSAESDFVAVDSSVSL